MKNLLKSLNNASLIGAFALSFLFSCSLQVPEFKDLNSTLSSADELSAFNGLLVTSGLSKTLESGEFTVLAPTNDALAEVKLSTFSNAQLLDFLKMHIVPAYIESKKLSGATKTLNGDVYFSRLWSGDVAVNGITNVALPISANNSLIYRITKALRPPNQDIENTLKNNPDFSEFVSLLALTDIDTKKLLSSGNGLTLFVPNNAAFEALYKTTSKATLTNPTNKPQLTNILTYHILNGRIFTTDFETNLGGVSTNYANGQVFLGSLAVRGKSSGLSNLLTSNILATNGVVHTIDKVLVP
jgi:transforming growth factor-beta-induced protein